MAQNSPPPDGKVESRGRRWRPDGTPNQRAVDPLPPLRLFRSDRHAPPEQGRSAQWCM